MRSTLTRYKYVFFSSSSSFQDDTEPLAVEGKETGTRWVASVAEFSISGVFEWDLDLLFPNLGNIYMD
jgi:hypothetical protein